MIEKKAIERLLWQLGYCLGVVDIVERLPLEETGLLITE